MPFALFYLAMWIVPAYAAYWIVRLGVRHELAARDRTSEPTAMDSTESIT